jgi:hypothetical protein
LAYVNSLESLGDRDMKLLTVLALIFVANAGLLLWGEAPLVWSTSTNGQWNRSCRYYYPVRTFEVVLPLSQVCPRWMSPPR